MRTIWKWTLSVEHCQTLPLPKGGRILTVQGQGDKLSLWAEVDPDAPLEPCFIEIFGTGHSTPDDDRVSRTYLGTVQLLDGVLVLHVYLREEPST